MIISEIKFLDSVSSEAEGKVFLNDYNATLLTFQVSGDFSATLNLMASVDGVNFHKVRCIDQELRPIIDIEEGGIYTCGISGYSKFRLDVISYESGEISGFGRVEL